MNSTVPGALNALVELLSAAQPDLEVGDSSLLDTEQDLLVVGYDDGETPAVEGTRRPADAAMGQNTEIYEINNLLSVWIGDADTAAVRTQLFAYLDALDQALSTTPLNAPGVARAYITDFSLAEPITDQGSAATLRFTVHIDAWRTP